ncbi:MAG: thioredoxin family protein [Bacteroidetes bacterium]|nr:thioredoxin family protein [Bacteroidota bacterium]
MAANARAYSNTLSVKGDATEIGIKFFEGTWAEALEAAKKDKKVIFLDAYASWCGPCKRMSAMTFTDESVGAYFNEHFISYKMDMEKHSDGPRLSTKYGLQAYPTLYFVDSDENIVHQTLGYMEPSQLISAGEVAVSKKN